MCGRAVIARERSSLLSTPPRTATSGGVLQSV